MNRLLFENAELFDPEEGQPVQASLLVESGRIRARVSAGEPVSEDVRRIDLAGRSLAPGFLDLHFHGEFVFASSASLPALLERTSRSLLEFGTTGYLVTSVAWPSAKLEEFVGAVARAVAAADARFAAPIGIHLEGPWINPQAAGAQPAGGIRIASAAEVDGLLARASGGIKMVTLAPELDGTGALLSALSRSNIVAALGHSLADARAIDAAVGEGLRHVTHLFNAMGPLHHREPGVAGHVLADDRLSCDLICDGVHVHRDMVVTAARAKRGRLALITDRIELPANRDGEPRASATSHGRPPNAAPNGFDATELTDDGVAFRLASGRLAGSSLTLDRGLRNICEMAAMSRIEAVAACTLLPARLLGLEGDRGTLRVGARADFAVLDRELRVVETWVAGQKVYSGDSGDSGAPGAPRDSSQ